MVNQWPFGPGLCHVFDIVSERVLPNKKLSAREQTSLQGALLLALKNAEDLRAVIITTYIEMPRLMDVNWIFDIQINDLIYRGWLQGFAF